MGERRLSVRAEKPSRVCSCGLLFALLAIIVCRPSFVLRLATFSRGAASFLNFDRCKCSPMNAYEPTANGMRKCKSEWSAHCQHGAPLRAATTARRQRRFESPSQNKIQYGGGSFRAPPAEQCTSILLGGRSRDRAFLFIIARPSSSRQMATQRNGDNTRERRECKQARKGEACELELMYARRRTSR